MDARSQGFQVCIVAEKNRVKKRSSFLVKQNAEIDFLRRIWGGKYFQKWRESRFSGVGEAQTIGYVHSGWTKKTVAF